MSYKMPEQDKQHLYILASQASFYNRGISLLSKKKKKTPPSTKVGYPAVTIHCRRADLVYKPVKGHGVTARR